jgi:hypothetical protein
MFKLFRNVKQLIGFSILIGLFSLGVYALHGEVADAKETLRWPTTEGVIDYSQVGSAQERDSDGYMRTMYFAQLKYSYKVNGSQYSSDKYEISKYRSTSRDSFVEIVKQYPAGSNVTVYYNPKDFNEAILKPGVPFLLNLMTWIFTIVTAVMWLIVLNKVIKLAFGLTITGAFLSQKGARVIGDDNANGFKKHTGQTSNENKKPVEHSDDAFDLK